eukprot:gene4553-9033_t
MDKDLETEGDGDGYSGTFRWKATKKLGEMPLFSPLCRLDVCSGWMKYFLSRCPTDSEQIQLVMKVQKDLSIIDCLSFPVTISHMIHALNIKNYINGNITIVCIGSSSKAEGRTYLETNVWNELSYYLGSTVNVSVWLVGPEMTTLASTPLPPATATATATTSTRSSSPLDVRQFRGTAIHFFRLHKELLHESTIVVGLNCGFGNWDNPAPVRYDLLRSWLPDLYFLTATSLPLLFTCANEKVDLVGEIRVMTHILGANFISQPTENPFSFASTMVPPNARPDVIESEYYRGNSHWYAVQGHDRSRRRLIDVRRSGGEWLDSFHTIMAQVEMEMEGLGLGLVRLVPLKLNWTTNSNRSDQSNIATTCSPSSTENSDNIATNSKLDMSLISSSLLVVEDEGRRRSQGSEGGSSSSPLSSSFQSPPPPPTTNLPSLLPLPVEVSGVVTTSRDIIEDHQPTSTSTSTVVFGDILIEQIVMSGDVPKLKATISLIHSSDGSAAISTSISDSDIVRMRGVEVSVADGGKALRLCLPPDTVTVDTPVRISPSTVKATFRRKECRVVLVCDLCVVV